MKTNSSHTFGRRSLLAVGVLAATAGAGLAWWRLTPKTARSQEIEAFWSSRFEQPSGAELDLKALRGQPLLVNFWATWCPPCVSEMPELVELQKDFAGKNFQIIGIGIDSRSNMQDFAKKHQISYPLLVGGMEGTAVSKQFGNEAGGLPFTVLITADGKVSKTYMGRLDMEKVRADLAAL